MPLSKITFQPGIHREGTQYSAGPSYYDCDKVRFRKGRPEKVGGWAKYITASYLGVCRSLFDWATADSSRYLGMGTNLKFYVEYGTRLNDVTPIRKTSGPGISSVTFLATNLSSILTVTDIDHGAVLGDFITFNAAESLGGVITAFVINQEYRVTSIVDNDNYTIDVVVVANGSDTGDGGTITAAEYQINIGLNNYNSSTGWGSGVWGGGVWGAGGLVTFANQLRLYSQDTFGDDLLFNPYLGGIYFWPATANASLSLTGTVTFAQVANGDATITVTNVAHGRSVNDYVTFEGAVTLGGNITADVLNQLYRVDTVVDVDNYTIEAKDDITGAVVLTDGAGADSGNGGAGVSSHNDATRAIALEDVAGAVSPPTVAFQIMVSPVDRHIIAFGCNSLGETEIDPLLVRWSDQESVGDWSPSVSNSAGGTVLSTGNKIIGAVKTRQEILVFTDNSIHAMRFAGAPFVYQFSIVGENVSMISPKAAVSAGDAVFFMGSDGFYVFQGSVRRLPCSVLNYVLSHLDKTEIYKIYATANQDDNEVTWFYPANGTRVDITNYVTYNHEEDVWTIGTFERGAWHAAPTRGYPIASSNDTLNVETNYLYNQEFGDDAEGTAMGEWIESGEVSVADGDSFVMLSRIIPDFKFRRITQNAAITLTIKKTDFPLIAPTSKVIKTISSSTKQLHVRVRAREVVLRMDGTGIGYGWTMGDFRIDIRTSGKR